MREYQWPRGRHEYEATVNNTQVCIECHRELPLSDLYRRKGRTRPYRFCRQCQSARTGRIAEPNPTSALRTAHDEHGPGILSGSRRRIASVPSPTSSRRSVAAGRPSSPPTTKGGTPSTENMCSRCTGPTALIQRCSRLSMPASRLGTPRTPRIGVENATGALHGCAALQRCPSQATCSTNGCPSGQDAGCVASPSLLTEFAPSIT